MVKIYLNNQLITKYKDFSIWYNDEQELMLTVTYESGNKYNRPYREWTVDPMVRRNGDLLYHKKRKTVCYIDNAYEIGDKYLLVKYPENDKEYIMHPCEVIIEESSKLKDQDVYNYFLDIAKERSETAIDETAKIIADNIVCQFDKLIPYRDSALHAYISKNVQIRKQPDHLIFPFGLNETQLHAVKNAFESQISVIEGPPGTGKTQTILNIISNIIIQGKTCAVVSNNNSAVENVYEKLQKKKLDFLIAKLGNNNKKDDFFQNLVYKKGNLVSTETNIESITQKVNRIEKYLSLKNQYAEIISKQKEVEIEKGYLTDWYGNNLITKNDLIEKYKLSSEKSVELMVYLKQLSDKFLSFKDKIQLLLHYHVFRSKYLDDLDVRYQIIYALQVEYYDRLMKELTLEKQKIENILASIDYDHSLEDLSKDSLQFLYQYVNAVMPNKQPSFTKDDYKKRFDDFIKYFPIIGSSTHSLVNSIPQGIMIDYVIIDEASQQDIVPGVLCLGCAKNIIVVGDRKQLPHIPSTTKIHAPDALYDCVKYSLLDSVCEVFQNEIPRTLLREHYRCHPKIIQFCNKQFYDEQLIPMTEDRGEHSLRLIRTVAGNHMRQNMNQREIDSILDIEEASGFLNDNIGFIAPYNNQIKLAKKLMPEDIAKDTIHKFQGRECDEIIFSTVLDKKVCSQRRLDFVDNASLVNVAVSRAKNRFTLVTGDDVFTSNNKHIAALIRYIEYYAAQDEVIYSSVISAFDLLYTEYDKALERLNKRLNPKDSKYKSEQIAATLLRDVLADDRYTSLKFHKQIYLRQLVDLTKIDLTKREQDFIKHGASCDFVLYFKVGKQPFAVIEVDGSSHLYAEQIERDSVKDAILKKAGIPILRLPTTSSKVEEHIHDFIESNLYGEK